ncbi:PREDICTED: transcription repressor OFP7-like [Nicotiana attenuata]|uniref:Transcription repressor n=1 Tax=Nicotiana attenuata TaxID=49451 RepID=A0A314LDV6_NICAT|nr:PREDICTED: transcription repressor OFP7-like [Nicotiana attenuata]OIT39940.1 transcription repressor ofp7 [Nicotiana attenuata]
MTKRFKLKLSMPSFSFCQSKKASYMPKSPMPSSLYKISPAYNLDISPFPVPPTTPYHPSLKQFIKDHNLTQKTYNSPISDYSDHDNNNMILRMRNSRINESTNSRLNNMSFASTDSGWCSECSNKKPNDESSFDVDYPIDPLTGIRRRKKNNNAKVSRIKRYISNSFKDSDYQKITTTKASVIDKLMPCMADGKVNESFAIVKKSADPYEDFKNSMKEMIIEKQMFEAEDLEQLLLCFLSLNSRQHHAIIVEAFAEIWEELFGKSSKSVDLKL